MKTRWRGGVEMREIEVGKIWEGNAKCKSETRNFEMFKENCWKYEAETDLWFWVNSGRDSAVRAEILSSSWRDEEESWEGKHWDKRVTALIDYSNKVQLKDQSIALLMKQQD